MTDGVVQTERMNLNPEPLKAVRVLVCRGCRKRAPWCSCGEADYFDPQPTADSVAMSDEDSGAC